MERGDARRICCRRSAQLTRRQTTSPSVNLPLSPLPEVAVGAAAPLLSFFFLHFFPFSGYGRWSFRRVIFIFCLFDIILYYLSFMFPSPLIL
ncbi:uncharacterized protein DS421_13g413500 [Arachis hypogaea]|nr:uncharacterized protein DS421_13g413500 [Arachis hypogaea]